MKPLLCFLFVLVTDSLLPLEAKGLKILGGYVEEFSKNSKEFYGKSFEWGLSEADKNTEARLVAKMYCMSENRQIMGFCYQRLIVSMADYPYVPHYQIVGSYVQMANGERKYENGVTEESGQYEKIQVSNSKIFTGSGTYNFGDLFFFVESTTGPSITADVSLIYMRESDNNQQMEEKFWDCSDGSYERVPINKVGTYTSKWALGTELETYLWRDSSK